MGVLHAGGVGEGLAVGGGGEAALPIAGPADGGDEAVGAGIEVEEGEGVAGGGVAGLRGEVDGGAFADAVFEGAEVGGAGEGAGGVVDGGCI